MQWQKNYSCSPLILTRSAKARQFVFFPNVTCDLLIHDFWAEICFNKVTGRWCLPGNLMFTCPLLVPYGRYENVKLSSMLLNYLIHSWGPDSGSENGCNCGVDWNNRSWSQWMMGLFSSCSSVVAPSCASVLLALLLVTRRNLKIILCP